jgi:hypothetical protein
VWRQQHVQRCGHLFEEERADVFRLYRMRERKLQGRPLLQLGVYWSLPIVLDRDVHDGHERRRQSGMQREQHLQRERFLPEKERTDLLSRDRVLDGSLQGRPLLRLSVYRNLPELFVRHVHRRQEHDRQSGVQRRNRVRCFGVLL